MRWTLVLTLVIWTAWVAGAEFLVAPGQPGGNGSRERPFASLTDAIKRAGNGDTIYVLRGHTYREPMGLDFHSGVTVTAVGPADEPAP
ncbi:MAG TPA: hypothetical protein VHX44_03780, partial [Planctomycetota bacterium]|nr:hypothetical protein [Planctomycetota bacterium]